MKKFLIMMLLAISMASCDSGGGSGYTPSSTYSQPKKKICPQCKGYGQILNPFEGVYQTCLACNGYGEVLVSGRNPSFGGHTGPCTNPDCKKRKEGHPCLDYRAGSSGRSNCGYCGCSSTDHGL